MKLSIHDRAVLRVSRKLLIDGADKVEIGDRVKDRWYIAIKLKKEFPGRIIETYDNDRKLRLP